MRVTALTGAAARIPRRSRTPAHRDQHAGLEGFARKDGTWTERRPAAIDFWVD